MKKNSFIKIKIFLFAAFMLLGLNSALTQESKPLKHNPWSLIIYRPENSPELNDIRCWMTVRDAETGEDVTYTKLKAAYAWISTPKITHKYQRRYYLSGGMCMHINIRPGRYIFSFKTEPKDVFNFECENKGDWISNEFYYDTENPAKVIWVIPTANENGFYNGGWVISAHAPEYWKLTKPIQK